MARYKTSEEIWRRTDGSRFRIVRIVNAETYKIIGEQRTELTPANRPWQLEAQQQ